jgi:hypothetical protein
MEWLKDLDDRFGASSAMKVGTEFWLEGIPPAKIAHFAGEARVLDAAELRDVNLPKRLALLACLVHTTRVRGRDEPAGMLDPLVRAGGVTVVSAQHAEISAHHGNNYLPLLDRFFKSHRKAMFDLLDRIVLESTSSDASVLAAEWLVIIFPRMWGECGSVRRGGAAGGEARGRPGAPRRDHRGRRHGRACP